MKARTLNAFKGTVLKPRVGGVRATKRMTGRPMQRRNARFLSRNPLCAHCLKTEDRPEPAIEVDHVVPLADGGADDWANLQGLCGPHHEAKTRKEDARRRRGGR